MLAEALLAWLAAILVSGAESDAEQPKCVMHIRALGVYAIELPESNYNRYYNVAERTCWQHENMHLLNKFPDPSEAEETLCGDRLVPLGEPVGGWASIQTRQDGPPWDEVTFNTPAANLSTGTWRFVNQNTEFACVLCQYDDVTFPSSHVRSFDDATASSYFVAHLFSADTRDSAEVCDDERERLSGELERLLQTKWGSNSFAFGRAFLNESRHLLVDYRVFGEIPLTVATGNATSSILNGSFVMSVEDVGSCPAGETVDADGGVTLWPTVLAYLFKFTTNWTTGAITRRDCLFSYDTFRATWDPLVTRWQLVWRNCTTDEQYANEEDYLPFLDAVEIDRRHAKVLQALASTPINPTSLQEVARLVDRELNGRNELYEETKRYLVDITARLVLDSDTDHSVATSGHVDLIVADLVGSDPAVGFTLQCDVNATDAVDNVTLSRKPTVRGQARALFAVDVAARLAEAHSRMAFVVLWKHVPTWNRGRGYVDTNGVAKDFQYLEVTVMFPRNGEVSRWAFASYGNHHVDIVYDNATFSEYYNSDYRVCVAWSYDLRDWTTRGCKTLYEGNFRACRCGGKYFALQDGVPVAKYALRQGSAIVISAMQNNLFTDFLKDKVALMAATAIECLLSLLGLGSIIGSAILFKRWRKNAGHKILLHMVLALTCNLVLGFTASFVHMDAEGVGCLIYGVLRHYSFLAMFLWMLVLSLLQMRRLMTVAGAKATTHLILKVSVFAWGLPLVPVVILLSVNPGFYQTDRFERGYCYPERIVFQVTVQTPAGLILLVNLGIFVNIVLNIFGCVGDKKITRHSKNEKAEQLNKLKTSLFIFFLFGFTWVFHFLSEERVFVSDFLFEYLFLMTATTHIFVLALFFVVFQESTRKEWIDWIMQKAGKH